MRSTTLRGALAGALFVVLPGIVRAEQLAVGTAALKQLSVEQVLDVEVTSVSKRPERPSEIQRSIFGRVQWRH